MKKIYKEESGLKFHYCLFSPAKIEQDKKYPLIVFLHGAGERGKQDGSELESVLLKGLPKLFKKEDVNCFMVAPQCVTDDVWELNIKELYSFIQEIIKANPIDLDKITLTGLSMGGFATWSLACEYPELFAGIAPVCGGGMTWRTGSLKNMPIRIFHGDKDTTVPIGYCQYSKRYFS